MIRVAFIGPESTGKTTLAELCSKLFDGTFIEESSREYLAKTKGKYQYEDLEKIAELQFQIITETKDALNFIDTDLIDMKVWSLYKYGQCSDYIQQQIPFQKIDYYFLCKPDFPWKYDSLRENPSDKNRNELYELFKQVLKEFGCSYLELEGTIEERISTITPLMNTLLKSSNY